MAKNNKEEKEDGHYANIRDVIGHFIGKTVVDITQHDKEDWDMNGESFVYLLFNDGSGLKFPIGEDGFMHESHSED